MPNCPESLARDVLYDAQLAAVHPDARLDPEPDVLTAILLELRALRRDVANLRYLMN
jgi:hypothetical protein